MRTADDLKLVELKAEHAARVLLKTYNTLANRTWAYVMSPSQLKLFRVKYASLQIDELLAVVKTLLYFEISKMF